MIPAQPAERSSRSVLLIDRGGLPGNLRCGDASVPAGLSIRVSDSVAAGQAADAVVAPLDVLAELMSGSARSILVGYGPTADMARALASGCRDYLCEPWEFDQMYLRVLRCLDAENLPVLRGRFKVMPSVVVCGERSEPLSWQEYRIADLLLRHAGACVPREVFNRALWGRPDRAGRALDVHVSKLRRKFRTVNGGVDGIRGCRRYGYMFVVCE